VSAVAIVSVMARYFDALHFADAELMNGVLHPAAIYATADEAQPLIRTREQYLSVLRAREAPAARGEARADRIGSIEWGGTNTALVRAHCSIGQRRFTDFLSLIRADGEWRIIAKVFAIESALAEGEPPCRS